MFRLSRVALIRVALIVLALGAPQSAWLAQVRAEETVARAMARRIDQLLIQRWDQRGNQPAPPASDVAFVRRVYLDLTGVIPKLSQVHAFLRDPSQDKRARLIDTLLDSPAHVTHMASTWRNILLSGRFGDENINDIIGMQNWLRDQFVENMRYDRLVADFLVASGGGQTGPAVFYTANDLAPEKLAASTARIFLGLRIECAQCHDHPFDHWTQQDFWGYAAFFARLERSQENTPTMMVRLVDLDEGELMLPETDRVAVPIYPGGAVANEAEGGTRRLQLAIWMASRDNPYLARMAVNRAWAHMFGRGLVEPVDDLGQHNPPIHPELLDELARYFIQTGFDLRELFGTLANTAAYQLSSESHEEQAAPPESFAVMAVKPLTPEQLYDCLSQVLMRKPQSTAPEGVPAPDRLLDPERLAFMARMQAPSQTTTQYWGGAPQALTLMNGSLTAQAASPESCGLLTSLAAPFFADHERVETLFLATLSRPPRDEERQKFVAYIKQAGTPDDRQRALGDILWALLNSGEFALNH